MKLLAFGEKGPRQGVTSSLGVKEACRVHMVEESLCTASPWLETGGRPWSLIASLHCDLVLDPDLAALPHFLVDFFAEPSPGLDNVPEDTFCLGQQMGTLNTWRNQTARSGGQSTGLGASAAHSVLSTLPSCHGAPRQEPPNSKPFLSNCLLGTCSSGVLRS